MRGRLGGVVLAAALALTTGCVPGPPAEITGRLQEDSAIDVARESLVRVRASGPCGLSVGSGFVIDGGRVVTNRHVVEGAASFELETWDGERVAARGAQRAVDTDLAVIQLGRRAPELTPLGFPDAKTGVGADLTALGFPMAGPATATRGSLLDRKPGRRFEEPGNVIRMSTSVRPGNSGGPLLDDDGKVVGVVFAYEVATLHALAVPRERLQQVLDDPSRLQPVHPC